MFEMKVGDRSPSFSAVLKNAQTDAAVDLSLADSVTARFQIGSGAIKTGAAQIVDGPTGQVRYDWAADDLDAAGTVKLEFVVSFPTDLLQTFPSSGYFEFPVKATLA